MGGYIHIWITDCPWKMSDSACWLSFWQWNLQRQIFVASLLSYMKTSMCKKICKKRLLQSMIDWLAANHCNCVIKFEQTNNHRPFFHFLVLANCIKFQCLCCIMHHQHCGKGGVDGSSGYFYPPSPLSSTKHITFITSSPNCPQINLFHWNEGYSTRGLMKSIC